MDTATFAAGCFWGVEVAFRRVPGVTTTRVGYTGGDTPNPSYEIVCTGQSGHAEAVEVTFDPARVGYDELLEVFWATHDPTQRDRQGFDVGSQYRSGIYVYDDAQREAARRSLGVYQSGLEAVGYGAITTEIDTVPPFYCPVGKHKG